jgi:hypothetical protein
VTRRPTRTSASRRARPPDALICASLAQLPRVPSFITACACGAQLWASNAMRAHVEAGRVAPTCQPCAADLLIRERPKAMIHRDQVEELRDLGNLHVARDVVTALNRATRQRSSHRK